MSKMLGKKKVETLRKQTGLSIVQVRTGLHHVRELCLDDGSVVYMLRDGTLVQTSFKWRYKRDA